MTNKQFIEVCTKYAEINDIWLHPSNLKEITPFYKSFKQYCIENFLNEDDDSSVYEWLSINKRNPDFMIDEIREKPNIVKKVCKELNITQKELSELLDVPQGTVNRWASNNDIPKMAQLALTQMIKLKEFEEAQINLSNALEALIKIQ